MKIFQENEKVWVNNWQGVVVEMKGDLVAVRVKGDDGAFSGPQYFDAREVQNEAQRRASSEKFNAYAKNSQLSVKRLKRG